MKIIQRMISFCMVLALLIGMVPPMAVNAEEMTAEAVDPAVVTVASSEPILIPTEAPEETSEHTVETTASAERATEPVEETLAPTEALTEPAEEAEEEPVREEAAAATSGTCGKNLTWNLTDGVLTISGTGAMTGYSTSSSAPWFSERMGITAVVIEAGVTSIGSHAFYYCVNMVSVSIPDTVESIGSSAFYECTALESVEIPHGVKYVGSYTFYNCTSLESVTIPDSVTDLTYGAFCNCSGLAEINIPGSVTYIGGYVFLGCTALKSLVIPEGVTSVSSELFYGCTSLESVTIPDSVTSIGSNAFYGCTKLEGVIIPAGVTSIGNNAFYNCSSLSAIKLPEGITGISSGTFYGCSGLEEVAIPRGVVTIDGSAFYGCTGLSSVAIPEGVTTIYSSAFYGCTGLSSVTIPEGVVTIGGSAFYGCTGLSSVTIPEGVVTIGGSAFYGCTGLSSVAIPEGVTTIENSMFYGCTSLVSIELPESVTTISGRAFSGCTGLASIDLPENLASIGTYAFSDCTSLVSIDLPDSLTSIGSYAFNNCKALAEITVPGGVTEIAYDTFENCSGLKTVVISEGVTSIANNAFWGCTGLETVSIPGTVAVIQGSTFSGKTNLKTVTLGEGVTTIGGSAFYGCTSLASMDLPESLTSIGGSAFYNCDALVEITIPGGVTAIANDTFENCSGLKTVVISEGVTSIANSAFWGCTGLETVSIPGTVAVIQEGTFSGRANLKTVILGEGVTTIGGSAFSGCTSLASIALPESLTSIGSYAFYNCDALVEITIPGGVTEIAGYTFQDCSGLKTVVISEGVTSIANSAFWGCTGLETVSIPGTVAVIQEGTFSGRANLKTVTLGEGVTTIGSNAFYDCDALAEITIPASVTCIDDAALAYCSNLTEIYFGHLSSAELVMAYNAFYLNEYDDYKDVPTVVYVPYARDIHSAISGYAWADYGRDVRFASSGCLPAQTVTIEAHQAQMEAGLEMTLTAAMDPWYCTSDLVWEVIPGTGEASIDQNGVLLGLEPGFVTVRCVSTDDVTVFDETQIEILAPTAYVSAITIRCDGDIAAEVEEGGSVQMLAQVEPGNAMDKRVTWEVENGSGKATITEDGVLSGIATGTVTVYATARDGTEVMGSLVVEVVRYVTDITICLNGKADTAQLGVGEKAALSAVVTPENANYTDVTWQLENGTGQAELTGDRYNRGLKGIASGTVILKAVSADSRKLAVSKEIEIVGEKLPYAVTGGNLYYNSVTGSIVDCDETVTNANIPGIIAGTRITAIAPDAFYDHDRLASVTIPSSVETIGNYAFYDCEGLSSLRINGSGLKTVGRSAFEYCRSLTNLTIPEGVTEIGYGAFTGLSGLKNLIIPGDLDCRDWLSYNGTLESLTLTGSRIISTANYELHEDGSMNWWGDTVGRDAKTVIIRDSVEKIEEFAFLGCDDLKTVTIGSGVKDIGRYAFYDCDDLKTVTIGSGVKDIERYAFYDCDALETITMGSKVKIIGKSAFESCGKLREVTLPEGIESLGESCFSRCSALEKINLPDSLKTIGRRCFAIESENGKLQLIDLSGNPTQMKEQELQLSYKIPTVLVTATNNKSRLWWNLAYTHEDYEAGKPDPYEIAWIDGETGMLRARGSGTVTVVCSDEYTGAEGRWTIEVSAGVVIRSEEDRDYVVSGETLQLSAWMMPANEEVDVAWTLRPQDTAYAAISENGKVTAKSVSGAHQIEVTAHPGNGSESVSMALWVVPKTTGLYIYEGSGDVTGSELAVDMAQIPSIQLTAVAQPEGAVGDVAWKTSAEAVASVDGGLVTFNSPGRVTITAAAADGSGKTASVTFSVTYRDTAKTLTAILDAPNNTLQSGQSARIHVYGADPDNALDTALLEFGVPDSQKHIATVDETGLVTAGETAGTVTVTAALKGDPLGRRVNVKITVIARQTEKLVLRTDAPAPAQVQMLDETGRITTDAAAAANYVILLSKRDVAEEAYTFVITPEAYTAAGSSNPGKAGLKWATSNSKLATVSVCDDGTALVTVKESADGACIISAVTTDDAKLENRLTINVRDYAPRLETLKPTLNTNLSQAAVLGLVESYGNAIRSVALYENGEVSARLKPVYEDGLLTITAETYIPNSTLELVLKVACADGLVYEYQLKAKVKNAAPGITAKQLEKFNLFYLDSAAALSVSAKDAVITHVELEDTFDFVAEFDAETGETLLRYSDRYVDDHSVKADTKATLLVYLEGYGQPARKSITIATVSKKPSVQTSLNASVINTAVDGEKAAAFGFVLKGTTQLLNLENARVDVTADFARYRILDDQVVLTLKGAVGGTATVLVQLENWLEAIKLTHKVTVETKTPTLKLGTGTLKLNSIFSAQTDETPVSLSQSNLDIGWIDFTSTAAVGTAARTEADKLNLSYDALSGKIMAAISDPDNTPKAGSYVFTAVASLSDGTALGAVKLKVTVAATAPKIKLKASALKLNKVLSGEETAVTDVTMTKGEGYTLIGFKELADWNHETVWLDFVDGQLTAQLVDADAAGKTSSFKLTPILRHDATGQESELPATVSLKVQVYSNDKIAVSLSAKGKLDAIDPNSEIRYTISKITNACGSVTGVSLEGADADRFDAVLNEDGTVSLKLVSGEKYSVKQTYKVQFSFTICGREVLSSVVSFKVTQSALKFTVSPANCCLYQSQTMPLTVRLNLAGPEGARLENITLGDKSSQAFLDAMAGGDMDVTVSEDGRSAIITFDVRNAASLAFGKRYVLYLDVTAEGSAADAKTNQVKLTVQVEK